MDFIIPYQERREALMFITDDKTLNIDRGIVDPIFFNVRKTLRDTIRIAKAIPKGEKIEDYLIVYEHQPLDPKYLDFKIIELVENYIVKNYSFIFILLIRKRCKLVDWYLTKTIQKPSLFYEFGRWCRINVLRTGDFRLMYKHI